MNVRDVRRDRNLFRPNGIDADLRQSQSQSQSPDTKHELILPLNIAESGTEQAAKTPGIIQR